VPLFELDDREAIEAFLRCDAALHLYELGDLDDFFFPHTRWFGLAENEELVAIALLYSATDLPVVVALDRDVALTNAMLEALIREDKLPARFYAHFTVGAALRERTRDAHGLHDRMILRDRSPIRSVDTDAAAMLVPADERELLAFFAEAYPGNWFDPRMLATRAYFGVRDEDGVLAAVSGVHVVSDRTRVAALGNVATLPARRGRGFARTAVAATCKALFDRVDLIGLNVQSENAGAIALYRALGFERCAQYEEWMITRS